MAQFVIRFRVLSPSDYHTPLCYLPVEETRVDADTADQAWEKWVTNPYASPQNWYNKIEIYQA
jgi:hypothetical protein